MVDELEVRAADGWRLGVQRHRPPGPARGIALLLHAMMADARTMDRPAGEGLATRLARAGWEAWAADFRGRGRSGPTATEGARWGYDDLVFRDVPALVAAARREQGGPVVVLGHSLGGHVAAASMASGAVRLDGLVGLAANVWLPQLEPDPLMWRAKDLAIRAFRASIAREVFPTRRLGLGSVDEAGAYVRDLARYVTGGVWDTRDGRLDWWERLDGVDVPVLAVLGEGDRLLGRRDAAAAWALRMPRSEVWVAGHGAHGVAGRPDHMGVVVDPASAPLHERVVGWMNARWPAEGGVE